MANYSIVFAHSAQKELESLSSLLVKRIFPKIEDLADNPRPNGCRKLSGVENHWRIRVGEYRVIYKILEKEKLVDIVGVRPRRAAY